MRRFLLLGFSIFITGFYTKLCAQELGILSNPQMKADEIIVKLQESHNGLGDQSSRTLTPRSLAALPFALAAHPISNHPVNSDSRLAGIYRVQLKENESVTRALRRIRQYGNVRYAEPVYAHYSLSTPNDPKAHPTTGDQYYLKNIKAYEAWDITKGSGEIIIGISDTGIDFTHNDISSKIYTNPLEIENNLDDDNNGYVDDINGYDFAENDNSPQCVGNFHGNRVAGLAGAATNNEIGMAGVGYHSTISPLKIFKDNENFSFNAYESILYAADNGYDVINLSWGSASTPSRFAQDIIDYAVLEKDLMIVAAAGNTNADLDFYPASYEHVLSVGWTDINDHKAENSTYSYLIDLVAPGHNVTSTVQNNGYAPGYGSSYAAPIVAGAAALIRNLHPHLNAQQVAELIRQTTDDIYGLTANIPFQDKLGSGRLNMLKALTSNNVQSVRANGLEFDSPFADHIFYGDTIAVKMVFTSYLKSISNLNISFTSDSEFVAFSDQAIAINFYDSMQTQIALFKDMVIHEDTPPSTEIPIRINYEGSDYNDFQYFKIITNPNYLNIENDKIALTLESNGNLASASTNDAIGFIWGDEQLTSRLGLIIGNSDSTISDNAMNEVGTNQRNQDFTVTSNIRLTKHQVANFQAKNTFRDTANNLLIEQKTLAFNDETLDDVIIIEYRIINTTNELLSALNAGMMADWDLLEKTQNKGIHDASSGISYTATSENNLFAGMKIYEEQTPVANDIDLTSLNGNVSDVDTVIDKATKYNLISSSQSMNAGSEGLGNDVAQVIAKGNFDLQPYSSKKITFILSAAHSFDALQTNISNAELAYEQFLLKPNISQIFTTCGVNPVVINPLSGTTFRFFKDPLGTSLVKEGESLTVTNVTKDTTFYIQNVDNQYVSDISGIEIKVIDENADFQMSVDTLFLGDSKENKVSFTDQSVNASTWLWDFDNGLQASIRNPEVVFQNSGIFNIGLTVMNKDGCLLQAKKTLLVARRPPQPNILDQNICIGSTTTISLDDNSDLAIFATKNSHKSIYQGVLFTSSSLDRDTIFYVSSLEDGFESERKEVKIKIALATLEVTHAIDTTSSENSIWLTASEQLKSHQWVVDGAVKSTSDTLTLLIDKASFQIQLNAESPKGCALSISSNFTFEKSYFPEIENETVCYGSQYILEPKNGSFFGFYSDQSLSKLIHKGESLIIDRVSSDTSVYIVGLDRGLPSDVRMINLSVTNNDIAIMAAPQVLNLLEGKNTRLSYTGHVLANQQWFVNDKPVSTLKEITLLFTKVDTAIISLKGTDQNGCPLIASMSYPIISQNVTPTLGTHLPTTIAVYPNPTTGEINIRGIKKDDLIKIRSVGGHLISPMMYQGDDSIDLRRLPKGIYILQILGNDQNSSKFDQVIILK